MAAAWDALARGMQPGAEFSPDEGGPTFFAAGTPEDYRPHPGVPRNLSHFLDRGSLLALDAALQAIESAGLGAGAGDARRFAVSDGAAYRAPGQATLFVPYGHLVARALGVRGPVIVSNGAEASGAVAVANAVRLVRTGQVDVVVAGAAQALQGPLLEHLRAQGFAARTPGSPFDAASPGFTAAEGAAYLVIEGRAHAIERGATILASIAGLGETFDSLAEPLANSDPAESGRAMQAALGDAGFMQNQVDLVVSCADGRRQLDFAEGMGIKRTFGRHSYFAGVTSVGGALGHTLAASGPLSMAFAIEAMRRQEVFPVAGLAAPEPELDLAFVRELRQEKLDCVLVTSLGMGGTNVSILLHSVS